MPEGFTSVADLKLIAETNDAEFRSGMARMREDVRAFQESSTFQLSSFDRAIKGSGGSVVDFAVDKLGKFGPGGKVAAEALKMIRDNWALVEDTIRAAGAGDQLDALKEAFGGLFDASQTAAMSLAGMYVPNAQQAQAETNDLARFFEWLTEKIGQAQEAIDRFNPDDKQQFQTLTNRIAELRKELEGVEQLAAAFPGRDFLAASADELRAKIAALEEAAARVKAAADDAADARVRSAIGDVTAQIDLLQKQREMLGEPGEFEWYKVELRTIAMLERAGIDDKEAIARVLGELKAQYLDTTGAIAAYNREKQSEAQIERTFAAMERETQNLKNRAAALSLAAGEAARLAAIESGLMAVRQARGGEAHPEDVGRIVDLANARAREAQIADDARVARARDDSFAREVRGIDASVAALRQSTAERAAALYIDRELDRIRAANRDATEDEIAAINANAAAIRERTQARESEFELMGQLAQSGQIIGRGFDEMFTRWARGAEMTKDAVADMAVSILADLARIAWQKSITEPLIESLFGGGGSGGGALAHLFGGARAEGGNVDPGKFYLVGEKGPELFVPKGAGDIVPNNRLGGGVSVSLNTTIDARGAYPESIADIRRAVEESNAMVPQRAIEAVREATERGGL